ncbi:MAG: PhzF family phenazine biosynthesis protein [Leptospiraceae bacterium]|nr:PhzF family phenazine biosynthesis protein [Leptospiraceae bacterium]MCP5511090.1 PhzF family phenazine biosynthesis protein [Leptospiraceae bacterium]
MSFLALVDAFTDFPFQGNPAVVCLTKRPLEDSTMLSIAREMNVSETAFLYSVGEEDYVLRWFTPKLEISLCGHATLAAAHILHAREGMSQNISFQTKSGVLRAELLTKGGIRVDFPTIPFEELKDPSLTDSLNFPLLSPIFKAGKNLIIEVPYQFTLDYKPDLQILSSLNFDGLIMTSKSENPSYDFISRYFAPNLGIPEDPVTGSAHCSLSAYWSKKLGKSEMKAYQASSRGGNIFVEYHGERTLLTGKCSTIMQGELLIS